LGIVEAGLDHMPLLSLNQERQRNVCS